MSRLKPAVSVRSVTLVVSNHHASFSNHRCFVSSTEVGGRIWKINLTFTAKLIFQIRPQLTPTRSFASSQLLGTSRFVEVVRRAITVEKYLSDARNDGCRILVEDPEKLIKEIVIF